MNLKFLTRLLWAIFALALMTVSIIYVRQRQAAESTALPVIAKVPEFTLTESSGQPFGSNDLRGKIWIADFIFTRCAGTCPVMTTHMSELQAELEKDGVDDVKLVSFTVDPENDTPEVLQRFAKGYGASQKRWYFLTGPGKEIQTLASKGFMLSAASGNGAEEPIIHSIRFVLVDRQGRIRAYYDGTEPESGAQIMRDVRKLLAEESS